MKIVIVRSSGIISDSRVTKEAFSLQNNGHSVILFGWDRSRDRKVEKQKFKVISKEIPLYLVGIRALNGAGFKKSLLPMVKFQFQMLIWLIKNRKNYDCIHSCDFDTGLVSYIVKKLFRKKMVYDIFDYYVDAHNLPKHISRIIRMLENHIINHTDATIICTEQRKTQIKGTKPKSLIVLHNSPNHNLLERGNLIRIPKKNDRIRVVYVGYLSTRRFIEEIVDEVRKNSLLELHIGGFGDEAIVNKIEKASSNYDNIFYYGKMQYSEVLALESECDVMIALYDPKIKNHYFAAPNKFYEALMLGKPIIMAKNTGLDKIISEKGFGLVIDYNKKSLESALNYLTSNFNNFRNKSPEMIELFTAEYSWIKMEERLLTLYNELEKSYDQC